MQPEEILLLTAEVIERESRPVAGVASQLDQSFVDAAALLLGCQGHILVAGSGTSHSVGAVGIKIKEKQ